MIAVVHRHPLVRQGIRSILEEGRGFQVVEGEGTEDAAFEICKRCEPSVVLIDAELTGIRTLEVAREIRSKCPDTQVILVASGSLAWTPIKLLQGGISGYISLEDNFEEHILGAVDIVMSGGFWFNGRLLQSNTSDNLHHSLTHLELFVLILVGHGWSTSQIAKRLRVNAYVIRKHIAAVYSKLGVSSRAEAVFYAINNGLTDREMVDIPEQPAPEKTITNLHMSILRDASAG